MATLLTVKANDSRDWTITLSDSSGTKVNLTSATVEFNIRTRERSSDTYFSRNTGGTGSDHISTGTATSGIVTITPTISDWSAISDYGIHIGEFKVTDSNSRINYFDDIEINIQRPSMV